MMNAKTVNLRELADRIRAIEAGHPAKPKSRFIDEAVAAWVPTGWGEIDTALGGGMSVGGLHEWFGVDEPANDEISADKQRKSNQRWTPPLCIMAHLARCALQPDSQSTWTLWIGRQCHPYPRILIHNGNRLLDHSLFVAPSNAAARLWAMDLALRSPAVGCVIADGSDFDRAATQRIQLLARTHAKMALTIRPSWQQDRLSAAQTRWRVGPAPPETGTSSPHTDIRPGWCVELLRCKGMRPGEDHSMWLLEWNGSDGTVNLSARVGGVAGKAKTDLVKTQRRRQQSA